MVYKRNQQSQPITFNDSTISSCLQIKIKPTSLFQWWNMPNPQNPTNQTHISTSKGPKSHSQWLRTEGEHTLKKGTQRGKRGWIWKTPILISWSGWCNFSNCQHPPWKLIFRPWYMNGWISLENSFPWISNSMGFHKVEEKVWGK